MPELNDQECLAILTANPRDRAAVDQAMETLCQRYGAFLRLHLLRRFPSLRDADLGDLCQETWLRVWKHLDAGVPAEAFRSWLFRIAGNLAIDRFRRLRI